MLWFYTSEVSLERMANIFVNRSLKEFGNCKQDSISVLLLGEKVSTVKLLCSVEGKPTCQYLSYGIVKGQSVILVLNFYKDVIKGSDLPASVRQIVTIR